MDTATEGSFGHLARAASKMLDQMHKGFFVYAPDTWTPNVNLYETATHYFVCVDLAGVEKEKIDIEVADRRLVLRGHRPVPAPEPLPEEDSTRRPRMHLMEIDHGQFARQVELPADADPETISANYVNGLLWIQIPRRPG